jgi:hypothetical protein
MPPDFSYIFSNPYQSSHCSPACAHPTANLIVLFTIKLSHVRPSTGRGLTAYAAKSLGTWQGLKIPTNIRGAIDPHGTPINYEPRAWGQLHIPTHRRKYYFYPL